MTGAAMKKPAAARPQRAVPAQDAPVDLPLDAASIVAARRIAGTHTLPQWGAILARLEAFLARRERRAALGRRSKLVAFAGLVIGALVGIFVSFDVGVPIGFVAFGLAALLQWTAPRPLGMKSPAPLAALVAKLAREIGPEVPVRIDADLVSGDDPSKATAEPPLRVNRKHKGKLLSTTETRFFADPWLRASATPAKGIRLEWTQADRHRCRTKTSARGKSRPTVVTSKALFRVRVVVPRDRFEAPRVAGPRTPWRIDVQEAGKWVKIAARQRVKASGTAPQAAATPVLAELTGLACGRLRPRAAAASPAGLRAPTSRPKTAAAR